LAVFLPDLLVALVAVVPAFLLTDRPAFAPDLAAPLAALAARLAPLAGFFAALVTRPAAAAALDAALAERYVIVNRICSPTA
jgi:uncharacterized membrane protein